MKTTLFVGLVFFCSIWSIGTPFRNCYRCSGPTYEYCERTQKPMVCYDTYPCVLLYIRFDNGTKKAESFTKRCAYHTACEQLSKGNFTMDEAGCLHPSAICKGKCCYEDECNKGNILADQLGPNSGKALAISSRILSLFFGLSLITVSIN